LAEKIRAFIDWLSTLHAPFGRAAPFAASGLFAIAGISHAVPLRILAYCGATALAVLIAGDIARSFLEGPPRIANPGVRVPLPMLALRALLTFLMASGYTYLMFLGMGLWPPFILWPLFFGFACFIAWRNVALWYDQGVEFAEELSEAEQRQHVHPAQVPESSPR